MPYSAQKIGVFTALALLTVACKGPQSPDLPREVTFAGHIAPIVHRSCSPCHHPGGAGPFSLIRYEEVAKRADMVAEVTGDRYMPPWPADPEFRHFLGEKVLTELEIALIARWAAQGAPAGDTAAIAYPNFDPSGHLGEPDLIVTMPDTVRLAGDNTDRFLFMKMPFELPADTFVRAIAFVPGNRRAVHHMNGHLVSFAPDKKRSVFDGAFFVDREQVPVQEAYPQMDLLQDDGQYPALTPLICSYLPGMEATGYPDGIGGFRLPKKGAFLLNDMHYGPLGRDTFDYSAFHIWFAPGPPKRPVKEIQLGTLGISDIIPPLVIPPDTVMTFRTSAVIQQDISMLSVNPHMHLLGKSFTAWAVLPSGEKVNLVRIPEWDFRWQYTYTFPTMLHLPRGTRIEVEAVFDNTEDNPFNPYHPPRTIAEREGSMRTTDEMLQFIFMYLPYQPGDESISLKPASN
jgi:hypothetical protein